jgi:hypothetical protein
VSRPSGVAAAVETANGWRLAAVEGGYESFHAGARPNEQPGHASGRSSPDASALLASAELVCGQPIDLVAIDMSLARFPITARRVSDNAVSVAYGARHCGTRTPSALRPGRVSDDLRVGFERAGYPLRTTAIATPGLVAVYPHPALVELSRAPRRLPYKIGRIRSYWPLLTSLERRAQLYRTWGDIVSLLGLAPSRWRLLMLIAFRAWPCSRSPSRAGTATGCVRVATASTRWVAATDCMLAGPSSQAGNGTHAG